MGADTVKKACLFLLLMTTSALAQEPSQEEKIRALKQAFMTNSNHMVGWGSMDMSGSDYKEPVAIKTDKIISTPKPDDWNKKNALDAIADMTNTEQPYKYNVCKKYGMRKVTHGDRWSCRK
jgi:hypothetical protein